MCHIEAIVIGSQTPKFNLLHNRIINSDLTALGVAARATKAYQDLEKSE